MSLKVNSSLGRGGLKSGIAGITRMTIFMFMFYKVFYFVQVLDLRKKWCKNLNLCYMTWGFSEWLVRLRFVFSKGLLPPSLRMWLDAGCLGIFTVARIDLKVIVRTRRTK